MRIGSRRGFTLIELLLVLVIVSSLVGISFYSMQTLMSHWSRLQERQDVAQSEYQALELVASALHGTIPYEVKDTDGKFGFYFLGRDNGFTGVTENSIYYPGELAVYRVLRENLEGGGVALFYEEAPLMNELLLFSEQTLPFSIRVKVLSNLEQLSFSYFGWESLELRNQEQLLSSGVRAAWHSEYDGMTKSLQPETLQIRLNGIPWFIQLSDRADILRGRRLSGL